MPTPALPRARSNLSCNHRTNHSQARSPLLRRCRTHLVHNFHRLEPSPLGFPHHVRLPPEKVDIERHGCAMPAPVAVQPGEPNVFCVLVELKPAGGLAFIFRVPTHQSAELLSLLHHNLHSHKHIHHGRTGNGRAAAGDHPAGERWPLCLQWNGVCVTSAVCGPTCGLSFSRSGHTASMASRQAVEQRRVLFSKPAQPQMYGQNMDPLTSIWRWF